MLVALFITSLLVLELEEDLLAEEMLSIIAWVKSVEVEKPAAEEADKPEAEVI